MTDRPYGDNPALDELAEAALPSHDQHVEGDRTVTVLVATELLAELREWSQPVQARIIQTPDHGTGYEMTFRINEADVRAERDAARDALADVDDELREAGIEYPLGARGVRDLGSLFAGMIQDRDERDAIIKRLQKKLCDCAGPFPTGHAHEPGCRAFDDGEEIVDG
jgi:hypothetical protein